MELHQLQMIYQREEDRILFRASFSEENQSRQEIRAWLTRRLVRNLWPGIVKALTTQVTLEQPQAAHASAEIINMEYQASVSEFAERGEFARPFASGNYEYPIGEAPLLVTLAHFTISANRPLRINFTQADGNGFEVGFTPTVLHGFCTLLQDAVKKAEWNIELELPRVAAMESTSRVLN